jgi:hypothetical protein
MAIRAEATVVPLYVAKRSNPPIPVAFAGTAFLIAPELLITCWHCVRDHLPSDQGYLALVMQDSWYADWLDNISQDTNGSDLATANIRGKPDFQFLLGNEPVLQGVDISAFGYPFSGLKRNELDSPKATIEARLFKGYVMRTFPFDYPSFGQTLSYELSFPVPRGLSGAPIIEMNTRRLVAVAYGNSDVAVAEHFVEIGPDGARTPEVQRIVSFGLAHHTATVRNLAGTATKGRPLSEIVKSG